MLDDVRDWEPQSLPDVIVCNAVLQWVPGHHELLLRWAGWLAADGWLADRSPGNFDQPSHVILREMAASARWHPLLRDAELNRQSADPACLTPSCWPRPAPVDAWETTYVHILAGRHPCSSGTRAQDCARSWPCPTPTQAGDFLAEYGERLRVAFPPSSVGTVFPFRRVFAVAHRGQLPLFPIDFIGKLWQDHRMRRGLPIRSLRRSAPRRSVPGRHSVLAGAFPPARHVPWCPAYSL